MCGDAKYATVIVGNSMDFDGIGTVQECDCFAVVWSCMVCSCVEEGAKKDFGDNRKCEM